MIEAMKQTKKEKDLEKMIQSADKRLKEKMKAPNIGTCYKRAMDKWR